MLVCGFCPKFFSADAATFVNETLPADKAWFLTGDGGVANATTNQRTAVFNVEGGQTVTVTRSGNIGGATAWWEISCFTEQPYVGITGGYYLLRVTGAGDNPVIVTPPAGYDWLAVTPVINATSSTNVSVTVEYETTVIPDIPSYDGTTGGSGSVVTGIQQGFQFDGVSIDTTTSQLTGSLVEETAIPVDDDEDGATDSYVLKSTYKVPVLVSCVITNTSPKYAWLNDKTIGYTPTFISNIPLLADAATSYKLCDIFYTSKGFADAVTTDGTIHFRFDDSNYYLGNVIVKPMSTLSASALLYYDITVITTVPAAESFYSYLSAVAEIMRTTIIGGVGLSGIDSIMGMLEYIPTDSTSMGQQQINNSVVLQGQQTQQAINALQTQQQQQFVEFTAPADSNALGNTFAGFEEQIAGIGFYALTQDIIRRVDDLIKSDPPPAEMTFPAFGLEVSGVYHQLWEPYTFSFTDWGENFPTLVSAVRFATLGVLCFWLVRYCNKLVHKIWGAA